VYLPVPPPAITVHHRSKPIDQPGPLGLNAEPTTKGHRTMDEMSGITVGSQYLSQSGRIWTVRSITPKGARFVLACEGPDGECGAVMDAVAVRRMVRIDRSEPRATADAAHSATPRPDFARA
jgi:hypothetical protein